MQLDNVGYQDLDMWNNIQKNLLNISNPSKTFTLELIKGFGATNLVHASTMLNPDSIAKDDNKEALMFKAYTWMANLTRRIMNENNLITDKSNGQMEQVFQDTTKNIASLFFNNYSLALDFVSSSFHQQCHPQEVALDMNKAISKIMCDYLNRG